MIQEKLRHNEKYKADRSYEIAHQTRWNSWSVEVDDSSCSLRLRYGGKYTKYRKMHNRLEHLANHLGFKTFAVSTKCDTKENTKKENWNKNKSSAYLEKFRISLSHPSRSMKWNSDFFNSCNHSRFSLFLRFRFNILFQFETRCNLLGLGSTRVAAAATRLSSAAARLLDVPAQKKKNS